MSVSEETTTTGLESLNLTACRAILVYVLVARWKLVNTNSIQKPSVFATCNRNGYF